MLLHGRPDRNVCDPYSTPHATEDNNTKVTQSAALATKAHQVTSQNRSREATMGISLRTMRSFNQATHSFKTAGGVKSAFRSAIMVHLLGIPS